jgi:hypothetical protein
MANIAEILKELQSERDQLDQAINALQPLASLNGRPATRPRKLSLSARRRIAAAARARWARVKSGKSETPRTHVVSLAARRKMAAAQKARWARAGAQQGKKAA